MADRPPWTLRLTSFARPPLPGAPAPTASGLVNQRAPPEQIRPTIRPAGPTIPDQPQQASAPPTIELPDPPLIALANPPVTAGPKPPPMPQASKSPTSKSAHDPIVATPPRSPAAIKTSPEATADKSLPTQSRSPLPPASPASGSSSAGNDLQSPRPSVVPPPSTNSGAARFPAPLQSPKSSIASPPSPFALAPPVLSSTAESEPKSPVEAEKRTVSVQDAIDKPHQFATALNGNGKVNFGLTNRPTSSIASNGGHEKVHFHDGKLESPKKTASSDPKHNRTVVTVTMAGDNKGAIMELGSPSRRQEGNISGDPDRGTDESESGHGRSEGEVRAKDDGGYKTMGATPLPFNAYINSNVQGVNNSILYKSTCTESKPGVQLYKI